MRLQVRHRLSFEIGPGRAHAVQQVLLSPQSGPNQTVVDWRIEMDGFKQAASFYDAYGNTVFLVSQTKPEATLPIAVTGTVDTVDRGGVLGRIAGEPVPALFRRVTELTRPVEAVQGAFIGASTASKDRIALLHGIMARVGEVMVPVEAPAAQKQEQNGQSQSQSQGAAPDSQAEPADAVALAHAFIATARALQIPARFVSGYLAADEDAPAALHAWAEAYDDGLGWIAFDPLLQVCPTTRHIRVATGLDALTVKPVRCIPAMDEGTLVEISVAEKAA